MYRREWLAATAVGCGVSVAGCSVLFDDEQSPTDSDGNEQSPADGNEQSPADGNGNKQSPTDSDGNEQPPADGNDDERSSITESQRTRVVDEIQAVKQSTAREIASIEASARNEITDIRNTTIRKIELLEGHGENWLRRPNSQDGRVLVDTTEDFVRKIRREAEKGRERIQTVSEWEQRAIERVESDGRAEIEEIPGTLLDSEPDDEIQTAVQTAVDNLGASAQESKEAIDTVAQEANTTLDETAQQSIENLESGLAGL